MTGNKDIMYTYERVENASVEIDKTVYDPEMGNGERKTDVDYFLKVYTGKDKQITGVMKEFFHALHNGRLIHLTIDRHDEFRYCMVIGAGLILAESNAMAGMPTTIPESNNEEE